MPVLKGIIERLTLKDCLPISGRLIIEQYTGLKDRNGKEIYEGDIVKIGGEYALIVFDETKGSFMGCFVVVCDGNEVKGNDYIFAFCPDDIMIVGNIHENPELWRPYYGPR